MFTPGAAYKLAKNFNISLKKIPDKFAKTFGAVAQKEINAWRKDLYKRLSKHAAANIVKGHRQRPDDTDAPHFNKHEAGANKPHLRDTIRGQVTSKFNTTETKRIISIVAGVGIYQGGKLEYAEFTNDGKPGRKDNSTPSWEGWMDKAMLKRNDIDRFFDEAGREMPSMSDILDNLFNLRSNL